VSSILELLWLVPLGFIAGGYGTLIGAGGGFILAPSLLLIYPDEAPETLTVISLCVVFFNSLSGTLAYLRSGRIDFKAGVIFALATMPGAVAGALTTAAISRARFNLLFGILLIIVAVFLVLTPRRANAVAMAHSGRDAMAKPGNDDDRRCGQHMLRFYFQLLGNRRRVSLRSLAGLSFKVLRAYRHRHLAFCVDPHLPHWQHHSFRRGSF